MRDRLSRNMLSLFMAVLFVFCILLPPMRALAVSREPDAFENLSQDMQAFIERQECNQFEIGKDTNQFIHGKENFSDRYRIDDSFLDPLKKMATAAELKEIEKFAEEKWGGSCYGIASTMVLNYLTKKGDFGSEKGLLASDMQAGAEEYFDLGAPLQNKELLNWINYYMYAWGIFPRITAAGDRAYANAKYADGTRYIYYNNLNDVAVKLINKTDKEYEGRPCLFNFGYSEVQPNGKRKPVAHAIVCCDYMFEVDDNEQHPRGLYCFKFYDENDRGYQTGFEREPRFHYIMLERPRDEDGNYGDYSPLRENCTAVSDYIYLAV